MECRKGVMCVVACPLLENELVYSLSEDGQPKRVLLADNGPAVSIKRKMDAKGIEYELISENEFFHRRDNLDPEEYNVLIFMNSLGLHAEPAELRKKVEDDILRIGDTCDCISLYYGLCGNAMWDPEEWASHVMKTPVHIFRGCGGEICDDCVGVAVSGTDNYFKLLKRHTGQFLVIPAIAENWEEFIGSMEMMKGAESMDMDRTEYMRWMFELCGYKYAAKLDTGLGDSELYKVKAEELAEKINLELVEGAPDLISRYSTDAMYEVCKSELPLK